MKDKEKQITEMAKLIYDNRPIKDIWNEEAEDIAKTLYEQGYRKITDSVVLTKEEYEKLTAPRLFISKTHLNNKDLINELNRVGNYGIIGEVSGSVELLPTRVEIEKETAEKIFHTLLNCHGHFSEEHANEYSYSIDKDRKYMFVSKAFILKLAKQCGVEIKE